jgi:ArsR family transcriptional regulator
MDKPTRRRLEARARVLKALAHPTRLHFVEELERGERCVCELVGLVDADVSTVSRHLAVLREAGLVEDERRGKKVFYRLRMPCLAGFFGCIESMLAVDAARRRAAIAPTAGREAGRGQPA